MAFYTKQFLIYNNFLDKTDNLMVYVQRKGHPQLWVPLEKLLSVGSILRGGLPHTNSDTREGPPLENNFLDPAGLSLDSK